MRGKTPGMFTLKQEISATFQIPDDCKFPFRNPPPDRGVSMKAVMVNLEALERMIDRPAAGAEKQVNPGESGPIPGRPEPKRTRAMKYMLLMNTPRDGYTQYLNWPKEILEANMAFMHAFTKKLIDAGELAGAEGLASPEQAKRVRAGKDGRPITDGVFPESKELLAGYWTVDVGSEERALALAAEASTAPGAEVRGADGKPIQHLWIEVRQVLGSHEEL